MPDERATILIHRVDPDSKSKVAVVFLHGFSGDIEQTWGQFPRLLIENQAIKDWDLFSVGYTTSLTFDVRGIWSAEADLSILSSLLCTILSHAPLDRYQSLAIIAHSMGGLVAQRALVDDLNLAQRIGHLVLFGTPSNGLVKAAWFKFWKRQIADMLPESHFLKDLRQRWTHLFEPKPPFRFFAVAGELDQFVPPESSIEPFPFEQRQVVPGNHLEIVKPSQTQDLSVQVVIKILTGEAAPAGPWNAARVAVESRDFQRAIHELWQHRDELDDRHLVILALALESVGKQEDAIEILEKRKVKGTDPLGVLGGRLKRRWLTSGRTADADRALQLYSEGLARAEADHDWSQAFYHAINLAFLNLGQDNRRACHEMAQNALEHVGKFEEIETPTQWSRATKGEAYLYLSNPDNAVAAYEQALALSPLPREIASMYAQADQVATFLNDRLLAERLRRIFRAEEA